jgi:hypothetical protein
MHFRSIRPIATCRAETCEGCPTVNDLRCHFKPGDLIHFYLIVLPSFILGGAGILSINGWVFLLWIGILVGFFGFLETRVLCAHCPHYAEPESSLRCWANYGLPKIWKRRPGPMTLIEKSLLLGGFAVVWGYPLVCMFVGKKWFLLVVYALSASGFFLTLKKSLCTQCMNFACPLNAVADGIRSEFFKRNPDISKAWNQ